MKRLFAAVKIHPDEGLTSLYWAIRKSLRDERITWVDPDNMHITLKFFGETPEHHIPGISVALKEAARDLYPFTLSLNNTGIFGSSYKPRVIWFGIDKNDEMLKLYENVNASLEAIGIKNDRQNFVPHLTVGRIKSLSDKKHFQRVTGKYREVAIKKEEVKDYYLFESILSPQGPKYVVIESYPMGGPNNEERGTRNEL